MFSGLLALLGCVDLADPWFTTTWNVPCAPLPIYAQDGVAAAMCDVPNPHAYEHVQREGRTTLTVLDTAGWGPSDRMRVLALVHCENPVAVRPTMHQGHLAIDHVCAYVGTEVKRTIRHRGRWLVASVDYLILDTDEAFRRADAVFDQVRFRDLEVR